MLPTSWMAFGNGFVWLQVAVFLAIVFVRVSKPSMIRSLTLYRWASTLLIVSILMPTGLTIILAFFSPETAFGRARNYGVTDGMAQYMLLCNYSGPLALSACMACFFAALAPPVAHEIETKAQPTPARPTRHPLD